MRLTGRDPASGRTLRVTVEDGRIGEIRATDEPSELWLAPGLVDLQVNGFAGHDINAPDVDEATQEPDAPSDAAGPDTARTAPALPST